MKTITYIWVFLALVAVAVALQASDNPSPGLITGNINIDLFGESSLKHNLEALLDGLKEVLKNFGLEGVLSGSHRGSGKLQAGLDFGAVRNKPPTTENAP